MSNNGKYIKQKYDYTPNDYDLNFNYNQIPLNIKWKGVIDLQRSLDRNTPLSKKIHVHMNLLSDETINGLHLVTKINWRNIGYDHK